MHNGILLALSRLTSNYYPYMVSHGGGGRVGDKENTGSTLDQKRVQMNNIMPQQYT